jgi:DNA-binding NtrC family response regulator
MQALIVHAQPELRERLAAAASASGYEVCIAAGLAEARAQLSWLRPAAIVTGRTLPDGDGLELLDAPGAAAAAPVVVGDDSVAAAVAAMRRGAADYWPAPADADAAQALFARLAGASARASIVVPLGASLDDADRALILATLRYCGGVRKRAADLLGISLKTLYNRLIAYRNGGGARAAPQHPKTLERTHAS